MSDRSDDADVTVVVCTRNRGDSIVETLQSLFQSDTSGFELLIIDQSSDGRTATAIEPYLRMPGVRYIHSDETGVSKSRNLGLREASHEFVVMTDDDCVVPPDWISTHVRALVASSQVALVFGDVVDPVRDPEIFTPESIAKDSFVVSSLREWQATDEINIGIGASSSCRRSLLIGIGGYDERFGPGSPLRNGEDTDLSVRVVLAGYHVVRITQAPVQHYGGRTPEQFRQVARASMLAVGAICAKLIRRSPREGVRFIAGIVWRTIAKPFFQSVVRLRKPPVLGRSLYFIRGLASGLRQPLNRSTLTFTDSVSKVVDLRLK